jgi:hypothetical protein
MLLNFQNVEIEMTYAFRLISENRGTDMLLMGLCTILGDTLIYFIAHKKNIPAWA